MADDVTDAQHDAARIEELRAEIVDANRRYYELDAPTIADVEYDLKLRELQALEARYPSLVTPDSPTQQVSGRAVSSFAAVRHRIPRMSLDNAFSFEG
ncbi:MAG: NAD-dependent DNA ligase LigA, partial [Acidimicrobiia bacterium]